VGVTKGHLHGVTNDVYTQALVFTWDLSDSSDTRRMWHGLQTITDYKGKLSRELHSDANLSDKLNAFYALFEASNTEQCMRAPAVPTV
jgi:hypothetical protein